jgi:hypothetical protein
MKKSPTIMVTYVHLKSDYVYSKEELDGAGAVSKFLSGEKCGTFVSSVRIVTIYRKVKVC